MMGAWGFEVWDNDEAADWFYKFGSSMNFKLLEDTIHNFDIEDDGCYDPMRAAAYVLEHFGKTYVWGADLELLDRLLEKAVANLTEMLNSEILAEVWWDGPEKIKQSLESQILALKSNMPNI